MDTCNRLREADAFHRQRPGSSGCRRGFTLVEMLVVIFIIGILMALLVPTVFQSRLKSKRRSTQSLIQKLDEGLKMYESMFQRVPDSTISLTVKRANGWQTFNYNDSLVGRSAQLHALLGARIRHVTSRDRATGRETYGEAGPFVDFKSGEIKGGKVNDYRKPIIDPWNRIIRVRYEGIDHTERKDCGSRNNEEWVDIWSEGPRIEKKSASDPYDGCDEDDINNFGTMK